MSPKAKRFKSSRNYANENNDIKKTFNYIESNIRLLSELKLTSLLVDTNANAVSSVTSIASTVSLNVSFRLNAWDAIWSNWLQKTNTYN